MRQTTPGIRQWRAHAAHASRTTVARALIIAILLGGFLAVGGAFDPMGHTLPIRLAFWTLTMTSTTAAALAMDRLIDRLDLLDEHPRARLVLEVAITSIPLTGLVWIIARRFSFAPPGGLAGLFPSVVLITAVMTALNYLAAPKAHPTHAGSATSAPPRFLERLPPKLRGAELYAVSAEDHYLRLHTSRGSDLILLRLADAIGELEGIEGAQTHRSWWVAKDAVSNARRADGRAVLTLKNGQEAPVSRSYAGALRKAGWY
jgi:hypothetical protein